MVVVGLEAPKGANAGGWSGGEDVAGRRGLDFAC